MKNNYVYDITNITNGMKYVGARSSKLRPEEDLGIVYFSSSSDKAFISDQKKNPEHYIYEVLETFDSREKAFAKEIELHKQYDVANNSNFYNKAQQTSVGFNFDRTGEKNSPQRRRRISESNKGRVSPRKGVITSDETKKKIGDANRGHEVSQETRDKISSANRGIKLSEETKKKIGDANRGKKLSEETKKKIGEFHRNRENNPMQGKHHSQETRDKISKANKGKVSSESTKKKISEKSKGRKWYVNINNERIRCKENDERLLIGCWQLGKKYKES